MAMLDHCRKADICDDEGELLYQCSVQQGPMDCRQGAGLSGAGHFLGGVLRSCHGDGDMPVQAVRAAEAAGPHVLTPVRGG